MGSKRKKPVLVVNSRLKLTRAGAPPKGTKKATRKATKTETKSAIDSKVNAFFKKPNLAMTKFVLRTNDFKKFNNQAIISAFTFNVFNGDCILQLLRFVFAL